MASKVLKPCSRDILFDDGSAGSSLPPPDKNYY